MITQVFKFIYVRKALFCSKINSVLQIIFHLATRMEREKSNVLGLHVLPWQLKLHTFDYTVITYE